MKLLLSITARMIPIAAIIFGVACTSDDSTNSPSGQNESVSEGLGSADASADVELVAFDGPDAVGLYTGVLAVTNNSSKTSDYYIEVNIEDADGTVLGFSNALVNKLEPGANARVEFQAVEEGAANAVITEVQRTASL